MSLLPWLSATPHHSPGHRGAIGCSEATTPIPQPPDVVADDSSDSNPGPAPDANAEAVFRPDTTIGECTFERGVVYAIGLPQGTYERGSLVAVRVDAPLDGCIGLPSDDGVLDHDGNFLYASARRTFYRLNADDVWWDPALASWRPPARPTDNDPVAIDTGCRRGVAALETWPDRRGYVYQCNRPGPSDPVEPWLTETHEQLWSRDGDSASALIMLGAAGHLLIYKNDALMVVDDANLTPFDLSAPLSVLHPTTLGFVGVTYDDGEWQRVDLDFDGGVQLQTRYPALPAGWAIDAIANAAELDATGVMYVVGRHREDRQQTVFMLEADGHVTPIFSPATLPTSDWSDPTEPPLITLRHILRLFVQH